MATEILSNYRLCLDELGSLDVALNHMQVHRFGVVNQSTMRKPKVLVGRKYGFGGLLTRMLR
ncbi:hypothetical protein H5410_057238 [Solanum commersonii]|uniref:Uncharacterized protein n=1 Tax=Solanum commersonii TaxID=4109 RepID=A0A9J5WQ12_SOLCO|nr:hypothetical protein H5410_057238 [Solanum commersonii]